MPHIESVSTALPPHVITQAEARAGYATVFADKPDLKRLLRLFDHSGVEKRHFAFPVEYYLSPKTFDDRNADYIQQATALAEEAARACLEQAEVEPDQVDHLILVTTTGLATPSLDALLVPRLGLRTDVRRWPLFGLGCAGGAGAMARACDVLRGCPNGRVLVVSVELCGQSFTPRATDPVDAVGVALFGDGAAAALVAGSDVAGGGPAILTTRTILFEDSKHIMGWRFTSDGMRLILSQELNDLLRQRLRPAVEDFLRSQDLAVEDIAHWILHPGGRRVIEAYREALGCSDEALAWTIHSLANVGNLSSASVLFVLADVLRSGRCKGGEIGVLAAPGPGFSAEMLVLEW